MAIKLHISLLSAVPAVTDVTTPAVDVRSSNCASVSFQLIGTGLPSCVLTVQGSNDVPTSGETLSNWQPSSTSWFDLKDSDGVALTATVSTATCVYVSTDSLTCTWLRVTSVHTGGTAGTLTVLLSSKSSGQ